MQQLKCGQRGGSGLAVILGAPIEAPPREASASSPLAIFALNRQQSCAPSLGSHSRALRRDDLTRCANKIPQHLPANRGVRFEQPIENGHAAQFNKPD